MGLNYGSGPAAPGDPSASAAENGGNLVKPGTSVPQAVFAELIAFVQTRTEYALKDSVMHE